MKSASFGSTLRVTWHDWTSPDLSCPPNGAPAAALLHDVDTIVTASGAAQTPRRHSGPVMRQPPGASSGTPEPSPTSS
jgi:hypothetical protein